MGNAGWILNVDSVRGTPPLAQDLETLPDSGDAGIDEEIVEAHAHPENPLGDGGVVPSRTARKPGVAGATMAWVLGAVDKRSVAVGLGLPSCAPRLWPPCTMPSEGCSFPMTRNPCGGNAVSSGNGGWGVRFWECNADHERRLLDTILQALHRQKKANSLKSNPFP